MYIKENIKFVGPYLVEGFENVPISKVVKFLEDSFVFCFDTEATGLDPHKEKVTMIQVGNTKEQYVIDSRTVDVTPILKFLEDPNKKKIGANLKFDYKMMLSNYGIHMQNLQDVMIREMVLECNRKHSGFGLAALTKQYCGVDMPKDVRGEFAFIRNQHFNARQIRYGGRDVIYPMDIWKAQNKRIKQDDMGVVIHLEQQYVRVSAMMEFYGMYVDPTMWGALAEQNAKGLLEAATIMDDYIRDNCLTSFLGPYDMFTGKPAVMISWSSQKQVVKLFKHLGIPTKILDKDKTKALSKKLNRYTEVYKDSIGKDELVKHAEHYEFAQLYLNYKKYQKAVTTYGTTWAEKFIHPVTGRVHTNFWQIRKTGRVSSSTPNLQQIPALKSKDKPSSEAHRTCFKAPEGRKLIVRDYSGCELRILADYSNEKSMKDEFIYGTGDLHTLTAAKVYSQIRKKEVIIIRTVKDKKTGKILVEGVNEHLRAVGKTLNFALSYGAGAYKISKSLNVDSDEGEKIVNSFYQAFPDLKEYFSNRHNFVLSNGYIVIDDYTKRRAYFPFYQRYLEAVNQMNDYEEERYRATRDGYEVPPFPKEVFSVVSKLRGAMERSSQNFPIQGTNASMTKIAMSMLYDYLRDNNLLEEVHIILALHDEIVVEAPEEIAEMIDKKLSDFMIYAGTLFCPNVPMNTDGGVCSVWDH